MKVIASWDDASFYDRKMADLMKKYNVKTVFYWPCNLDKSRNMNKCNKFLALNDCKELAKDFEVGSHTVTHNWLPDLNTQQARNEIFDSRKFWQDVTGQAVESFSYPRGRHNELVRILVKNAGYKEARTTIVGHLKPNDDPLQMHTTVHVGIDRKEYKDISWELFARKMIKEAKDDSVYHLWGHSWEIELYKDWENLENLLKELQ